MARVTYTDDEQREELWDIVTGLRQPAQGRVVLGEEDVYALPPLPRLALFRRIGVVPHDGGLISNLKVWENLALPGCYHDALPIAALEQPVAHWLGQFGLDERDMRELMRRLPEQLSASERAIVGLVRALLREPDIIVCSAPFSGVERDVAGRLLKAMLRYQRAQARRSVLYLLPDEAFSERVPVDVTQLLRTRADGDLA
jgi:phospholipid/cholesterol/gamma-HCH transport system ATP-binding protein